MKRLFIFHSFNSNSQKDWYRSVAADLRGDFDVLTPDLPDPTVAKASEWMAALALLRPDRDTILVGHSLSGILILRYLETAAAAITGFVLVAAPINDLARNDLHATGFFERDFAWTDIIPQAARRLVIASTNDDTVPFWQAEYLANNLQAELISLENHGHFHQPDFPELTAKLKEWAI